MRTIFINPTTHGLGGYARIPWLLLYFSRVVVYAPLQWMIQKGHTIGGFTVAEFREAISKGMIIPAAFETFLDKQIRAKYYPPSFRLAGTFDDDLTNRATELGGMIQGFDPTWRDSVSAPHALAWIENNQVARANLQGFEQRCRSGIEGSAPPRYRDLIANNEKLPESLEKLNVKPECKFPALVIYDLQNEKHVMSGVRSNLGTSIESFAHYNEIINEDLLKSIHGLSYFPDTEANALRDASEQVGRAISRALELLQNSAPNRLTLEDVMKLRLDSGVEFARDMNGLWLDCRERAGDDLSLLEDCIKEGITSIFKRYDFHYRAMGIPGLVRLLTANGYLAMSDEIENWVMGTEGSLRRRVWDGLHSSLDQGRWVYDLYGGRPRRQDKKGKEQEN